ncbi:MAG: hypothetical protein OFPII_34600 [Osedax symbiont Rs1]|nr:MAG: hypothetical protein OFPII_34600 [Osedax symbiont Rs1]
MSGTATKFADQALRADLDLPEERRFLFLQGPTSHFFYKLAQELRSRGHRVDKVNFNLGDHLYWGAQKAFHFRRDSSQLADYINQLFAHNQYTDVLVLGENRPVHRCLKEIVAKYNAQLHVIEEGYLRPHWLTLESHGVNGHSQLPKDPNWYRKAVKLIPKCENSDPVSNAVWLLALHEVCYHLPNILNTIFYPGYKTHRPMISGLELAGWAWRFMKMPRWEKQDAKQIAALVDSEVAYYLLPLQLDSDAQIIYHSPFDNMAQIIEKVLRSFAKHSPSAAKLVIKNHPLDTGYFNFKQFINTQAKKLAVSERVLYLESGHLPTLFDANCKGVVTINSTVGTSSLIHHCPTIALGDAIYDMQGLTYQHGLDKFWRQGQAPDKALFDAFRKVVIHTTQLNGGFYSVQGVKLAVPACADIMTQAQSPLAMLKDQVRQADDKIQ